MPTITLDMKELEKSGLNAKEIPILIDRLGMSVEKIEGVEIKIETTPNRPDLLEAIGLSRALKSLSGRAVPKEGHYTIISKTALKVLVGPGVKRSRPFIAAVVVKKVDLSNGRLKDLINFTEKLTENYGRKRRKMAIGVYDLAKMKGDLIYDASKEGKLMPLDASKEMSFKEVLVKDPRGLEFGGIIREESKYPYLRDAEKTLSLIPIVNSERVRVTESSKDLFIDATGTAKTTVNQTINIIAALFIDAGASVYPCEIITNNKPETTPTMNYTEVKVRRLKLEKSLGVAMEESKMIEMGNRMGHLGARYGNKILFLVPPYRADILGEQDMIEELAVAYGYDKINPIPIYGSAIGLEDERTAQTNRISRHMMGMGFSEAINNYLTNEKQNFEMMCRDKTKDVVTIAYAKTESISMLRTSILPSLLGSLSKSAQASMPQMLFEAGSTFFLKEGKAQEWASLAFVSEHSRSNFSEIKSYTLALIETLGIKSVSVKEEDNPSFIEGRCASLVVSGTQIGTFGEIHPKVLKNFKLEEPVAAAELDLNLLISKL